MNRERAIRLGLSAAAGVLAALVVLLVARLAAGYLEEASAAAAFFYLALGADQGYGLWLAIGAGLLAAFLAFWILTANRRQPALLAGVLGLLVAGGVLGGALLAWLIVTPDWRTEVAHLRWWLTARTPPTLVLSAPAQTVRGGLVTIEASMSGDGETNIAAVDVDGAPLALEAPVVIDTATLPDGLHTVTMHVEDASRQRNRAQASASFRTETQWWAGDVAAPIITVTVPVTIVSGIATIGVATSDAGEHGVTLFSLDGVSLPFTSTVSVDTRTLGDGEHVVVVEAQDASRQRNRAVARTTFRSDNAPPQLVVRLDPPTATQGHSQVIRVSVNEPVRDITATLGSRAVPLVRGANEYWAVVGYEADAKPGRAVLTVRATDYPGMYSEITATSAITIFSFPVENVVGEDIALPPDRAGLLNYGITETAFLDTIYAPVTPDPLWQGLFAVPVSGRQTSPFAIRRSYNGGPPGSFHGGVDIAADAGVRVPASNRGRVVLAELLHVRGNTVILDHGMGVYTAYCHLSQIDVRKGQIVDKGQTVGLVGDTGVSTGPHLHWELRVTGKAVDPWPWTQTAIP